MPSQFSVILRWASTPKEQEREEEKALKLDLEVMIKKCSSSNANRSQLSLQEVFVVRDSTMMDGTRPNRGGSDSDNVKQPIAPSPLSLHSQSTESFLSKRKYLPCISPPLSAHPPVFALSVF